jgi:hypothetical protein
VENMGLFVAAGVVEVLPREKPPVEAAAPPKGLPVAATPGVVGPLDWAAGFSPKLKLEVVGVCVEGEGAPKGLDVWPAEPGAAAFPKLKPAAVGALFVLPKRPLPEFASGLGAAEPNRPGEAPDDEAGWPKLKDMLDEFDRGDEPVEGAYSEELFRRSQSRKFSESVLLRRDKATSVVEKGQWNRQAQWIVGGKLSLTSTKQQHAETRRSDVKLQFPMQTEQTLESLFP